MYSLEFVLWNFQIYRQQFEVFFFLWSVFLLWFLDRATFVSFFDSGRSYAKSCSSQAPDTERRKFLRAFVISNCLHLRKFTKKLLKFWNATVEPTEVQLNHCSCLKVDHCSFSIDLVIKLTLRVSIQKHISIVLGILLFQQFLSWQSMIQYIILALKHVLP